MTTVQGPTAVRIGGPVAGNGHHPTDPPPPLEPAPPAESELPTEREPGTLRPMGRGLAWSNRQVEAQRRGWPDGALAVCEDVERERPGWSPMYTPEGTGFLRNGVWVERQPGFHAYRVKKVDRHRIGPECYGADGVELLEAIDAYDQSAGS